MCVTLRGKLWVSLAIITGLVVCQTKDIDNNVRTLQNNAQSLQISQSSSDQLSITSTIGDPSYDPDSCRSSWVSALSSSIQKRHAIWPSIANVKYNSGSTLRPCTTLLLPVTSTRTITSSVPSECDGFARAASKEETVETFTKTLPPFTRSGETFCSRVEKGVVTEFRYGDYYYEDPPYNEYELNYPTCSILPSDCPTQWSLFRKSFQNATVPYETLVRVNSTNEGKEGVTCDETGCFKTETQYEPVWSWMALWNENKDRRAGFFADCPQAQALLRQYCMEREEGNFQDALPPLDGLSSEEVSQIVDDKVGCEIKAKRFMLIYFPPQSMTSRSICADGGWGQYIPPYTSAGGPIVTTIVTELTFSAHDFRDSSDILSTPAPTSRILKGMWTFTSPSVYLAFSGMTGYRFCGIEKTYSDGILTVHPSDLSSIVGPRSAHTARPFNFADLQAPVPASVYFAGSSERLINGKLETKIVEGNYWPIISMPTAIRDLDPSLFSTCEPLFTRKLIRWRNSDDPMDGKIYPGVWDPPFVLQPGKSLAVPMVAANPTPTQIYSEMSPGPSPGTNPDLTNGLRLIPTPRPLLPPLLPHFPGPSTDGIIKEAGPAVSRTFTISAGGTGVTAVAVASTVLRDGGQRGIVDEKTLILGSDGVLSDASSFFGKVSSASSAIWGKGGFGSETRGSSESEEAGAPAPLTSFRGAALATSDGSRDKFIFSAMRSLASFWCLWVLFRV